ncbi:hypothetical protein HXA34_09730 [Salipaludibacillus agaradhaerens]|jgi:hypothetical protein|uniref:YphA family membrane protein n=1 Tax=Salipaludibacillus agaradhaerens TaxID=76935 RepID=UPI002150869C|nr:hypothetical protein [Salipaludibacillus agaradhaerens]MCR6106561.1 hypothetical protein [Salipaludibacillus agaradhaerens]MCR6118594.1 hypothetical protein [Salipaludibacillus agaradhaerens]UJW57681.1 hypothetical protein HXZ66_09855 [Bacillus sp. A116_S68]
MIEGAIFFWIIWLTIIYSFFLIDNKTRRAQLLLVCFLTIMCSSVTYSSSVIEWNLAWGTFLLVGLYTMRNLSLGGKLKGYVISLFIAYLFFSIHKAVYFEPVWLILSPQWSIIVLSLVVLIIFLNDVYCRVFSLTLGLFQGLILSFLSQIMANGQEVQIVMTNSLFFLDVLTALMVLVVLWSYAEQVTKKFKGQLMARQGSYTSSKTNVNV